MTLTKRHVFVSIEGLKGSGKTTVSRLLAEQLGAHWCATPPTLLRSIRDSVEADATSFAKHLYYFAGIAQASAEIGLILNRQPVVCDKFVATMLAYSRAAGIRVDIPSPKLIIHPDFSFLLQVPVALRRERIASRGPTTPEQEAFVRMEVENNVAHHYSDLDLTVQDNSKNDVVETVAAIRHAIQSSPHALDRVVAR